MSAGKLSTLKVRKTRDAMTTN